MTQCLALVRESRPRTVLLENVKGITSPGEDSKSAADMVIQRLRAMGLLSELFEVDVRVCHRAVRQRPREKGKNSSVSRGCCDGLCL